MIYSILNYFFSDFSISRKREKAKLNKEKTSLETSRANKYEEDVKGLFSIYGNCKEINISLQELLKIAPRKRARIEAYNGLKSYINKNYNVKLNITSRKTKTKY